MKRFFHPFLKDTTVTTSDGKLILDKDGCAEVDDKTFDDLMKIPVNAEHQAKLDAIAKEPENLLNPKLADPKLEKKDDLKEEDLQFLELPELRAIAKQHKITFVKTVTKPELIAMLTQPVPPPPPPPELP